MSIVKMREKFAGLFKPILIIIAATFIIGGVWVGFGPGAMRDVGEERGGNVIAKVNGEKISRADYVQMLQQREEYYQQMMQGSQGAMQSIMLRGDVLNDLINTRLQVQAAEKEGIKVSRKDVNKKIDELVEQRLDVLREQVLGQGQKKGPGTDRLMDRRLREADPNDSLQKRKDAFRAELPKDRIREMLMVQKLEEKIRNRVKITDEELKDTYKQVTARHILISTSKRPAEQAERRAKDILAKLKAREDFAKLAKEYSDDPGSKSAGGLLPPFGVGAMVPEFEKAAFALKPGETSDIVKSQFGFHIIRVEKVDYNLPADFEKKKKEYREQALMQKRGREVGKYMQDIREKAKIEIFDPMLNAYKVLSDANRAASQKEFNNKLEEAAKLFAQAIAAAPSDSPDWMSMVMLAQIRLQQNKKDEAIKLLSAVLDQNMTEAADLRMMLAQLYIEKGDKNNALKHLTVAADVGYGNLQVHATLQDMFERVGRPDLAKKEEKNLMELIQRQQQMQQQGTIPPAPSPKRNR